MYEHTNIQVAEYLGIKTYSINYHIRVGNLKATYKAKLNDKPRYYISHEEYLRFSDWFLFDMNKRRGPSIVPSIDEFDLNPQDYKSAVALIVCRNKSIMERKYIDGEKYNKIALDFKLTVRAIQDIVCKNKNTKFVEKLIIKRKSMCKKIRKTPNIDEYEKNPKIYSDSVLLEIERDKEILQLKYLNDYSIKDIAKKFKIHIVYKVISRNKETKFVQELERMRDVFGAL